VSRPHSVELLPDEDGQVLVQAQWQALREAGLPSQLDHRGSTNAPHVSVVEAPVVPESALAAAAGLGGLFPVTARCDGFLVLGHDVLTLARPVQLPDDVVSRLLAVRSLVPERRHHGWLPHLTLARRLPRADLARAIEVLASGHRGGELRLAVLRHWDAGAGVTRELCRR
jgi:2'-5' RNA ligase superfamily